MNARRSAWLGMVAVVVAACLAAPCEVLPADTIEAWGVGATADFTVALGANAERRVDIGGLAAGDNAKLNDTIELVNQVYVDLPQHGERAAVGVMAGFIATLPSPGGGNETASTETAPGDGKWTARR